MSQAKQLFEKDLPHFRLQAMQPLITSLEKSYVQSEKPLLNFLEERLHFLKVTLEQKQFTFKDFENKYGAAIHEEARKAITLEFSKALGASPEDLKKDRKAFLRWFDFSAVADRCRYQISSLESELSFIIDRLTLLIASEPSSSQMSFLLLLTDWAQTYPGNTRIKIIALESIRKLLTPETTLDDEVFYYLSLSDQKDVWIQCNAISILKFLNPQLFREVAIKRLNTHHPDPDFFVRQHITILLTQEDISLDPSLLTSILKDPSEFVRQALCKKIAFLPPNILALLLEDPSPQVRAAAILNTSILSPLKERIAHLEKCCTQETHPFVLRVCLKCIQDGSQKLSLLEQKEWFKTFNPVLDYLHASSHDIPTRRRAALTREVLWCASNPSIKKAKDAIASVLRNMRPGTKSFIPHSLLNGLKEEDIGRLFSLMVQFDFGCELQKTRKGYKVFKGLCLKFRLWRFLYEFFHPKTEKREAIRHTIGRHFSGEIQVPSSILAELSQTEVPGEPLYLHEEGGYRPYLPLVDHMLSILKKRCPFSFYTSEGITFVAPPSGFWGRLKAKTYITFHFAHLAELRNWRIDSFWGPSRYVNTFESLGFTFYFRPYDEKAPQDPTVTRFFAALIFIPDVETLVSGVLMTSRTSILGLSFCILIFCIYFFWHYIRQYRALKTARASLPLVIGGWGTRGKSSTDRLKAALINGMGMGVFAKTTGCEAKITFAGPYQKMHEIPYYRPYGKVSIWEQAHATALASKFKSDVMLWECMAIKPEYVKIMQQQWMTSDLSTLTNAYPDHEDLQGPAGYNVAESLLSFSLFRSKLLTAEEQMLPYFQASAAENNETIETVGWLEEGMLTNDILDRFPYIEHAQNITLILKMAKYFNISTTVALKEMADEVIPDIGALKVYPVASLNFRCLQFINGMSANEEYACLTNWYHLGFDQKSPAGNWISTLINNRVDRVARSRVFAQLLVHNLSADQHFVIGTNIDGFMRFVHNAWDEFLNNLPFSQTPEDILLKLAQKLRICFTREDLQERLFAMGAKGYEGDLFDIQAIKTFTQQKKHLALDALLHFHQENINVFQEYHALHKQLVTKPDKTLFKETLTKWFMKKFIFPDKNQKSGDEMITWICKNTPPYYLNKIMGIQNIKGPGLEFVYRWQSWEKCFDAGNLLLSPIPQNILKGFRNFMEINEFGVLSQEYLEALYPKINSKYAAEIKQFQNHVEEIRAAHEIKSAEKIGLLKKLITAFFDINVSYTQTNTANKIYEDLSTNRISYIRAHKELEKLVILNNKD